MFADTSEFIQTKDLKKEYDYLAPDGSEIRLLSEVIGGGLCHCTLPSGKISDAVYHKTVEEIWYWLSGKGEVWRKLGDREVIVSVKGGTSLSIPVGVSFQFCNLGKDPLCFLIATMPRWPGPDEAIHVKGKWH